MSRLYVFLRLKTLDLLADVTGNLLVFSTFTVLSTLNIDRTRLAWFLFDRARSLTLALTNKNTYKT